MSGIYFVQYLVSYHSPTGWDWGRNGSAPADLALNILETYLRFTLYIGAQQKDSKGNVAYRLAFDLHQQFKEDFLYDIPEDGDGAIPFDTIAEWVKNQTAEDEPLDPMEYTIADADRWEMWQ